MTNIHFDEADFFSKKFNVSKEKAIEFLCDYQDLDEAIDEMIFFEKYHVALYSNYNQGMKTVPIEQEPSANQVNNIATNPGTGTLNSTKKAKTEVKKEDQKENDNKKENKKKEDNKEEDKKNEDMKKDEPKKIEKPRILSKEYTKYDTPVSKSTKWIEIPIKELRDFCKYETEHEKARVSDYICPVCQEEYYENVFKDSEDKINELNEKMIKDPTLITVVKLSKCGNHFYHKECVEGMNKAFGSVKCPVCGIIYGTLLGDMPDGEMYAQHIPLSCAGYEPLRSIQINYSFPSGNKNNVRYRGTDRVAYLPDNKEGREILDLLNLGFKRRLLFIVGTSVTTGQHNTVVWNGVHHKTSLTGGATNFGYPDPTYFARVKEELKAKGILPSDIQENNT